MCIYIYYLSVYVHVFVFLEVCLVPLGTASRAARRFRGNGWCPGSVEPGIYLDVSEFLASGENVLELGLTVWLNAARKTREDGRQQDGGGGVNYLAGRWGRVGLEGKPGKRLAHEGT